eukprot:TRINITY_DN9388_c0_g2_i1.p1 TRINITY_DN9388_c0_g2~~TRINITY_DN9388_c0_g2_i1.p1  ORF type:complete len:310 (-),score=61.48 TRINITY_DN9388_c0_g2_i1:127-1056(-)
MALTAAGLFGGAELREWSNLQKPTLLDLQQLMDAMSLSPLAPKAAVEVARRAHSTAYPPHWSEEYDAASGGLYFYNYLLDVAIWQHPLTETFREIVQLVSRLVSEKLDPLELAQHIEASLMEAQELAVADLGDWVGPLPGSDGTGEYFHNRKTNKSQWEDPREVWQYNLQVRYDLLVGFLVQSEKDGGFSSPRFGREGQDINKEITTTLTTLASTMSSMASTVFDAMPAPEVARAQHGDDELMWARPREAPRPRGSLPLPPRATGGQSALFTSVSQTQQRQAGGQAGGGARTQLNNPPPPPPGDPPWAK